MKTQGFFFKIASVLMTLFITGASDTAIAQSQSVDEYQKTIRQLGAQGDYFYVSFNEPFTLSCAYNVVYIAADRKGLYAQLLAAKLSGKRISRIVYNQSGTGTACNMDLVEITD